MPKRVRFAELLQSHEKEIYRFVFRMSGNAGGRLRPAPGDVSPGIQGVSEASRRREPPRLALSHRPSPGAEPLSLAARSQDRASGRGPGAPRLERQSGVSRGIAENREGALAGVIRALPPRQRSALLLKKYEGLSYAEVAAVLRSTEENARANVYQAMKKIRDGLKH